MRATCVLFAVLPTPWVKGAMAPPDEPGKGTHMNRLRGTIEIRDLLYAQGADGDAGETDCCSADCCTSGCCKGDCCAADCCNA